MDNSLLTVHPTTEANWCNENVRTEGMLLRDYFAAQALGGMLASTPGRHIFPPSAATEAYEYADAMLRAREAS